MWVRSFDLRADSRFSFSVVRLLTGISCSWVHGRAGRGSVLAAVRSWPPETKIFTIPHNCLRSSVIGL